MFCGFISFFLLLNYYYYYLLYGIYEHTLKKQIHTFNKFKQAICAVPSLGRVMYDFEMHFFLLSDNPVQLTPSHTWQRDLEDDTDIPLELDLCSVYSWIYHNRGLKR